MVENYFVYNSGGRWFPNPYGEWEIKIDEKGSYEIKNYQGNTIKHEKKGKLEQSDIRNLWEMINHIDFKSINPQRTVALPEEAEHSFLLNKMDNMVELKILTNNIREFKGLIDLQQKLKEIIKKYAKINAVF
jgi:hypothetical protein